MMDNKRRTTTTSGYKMNAMPRAKLGDVAVLRVMPGPALANVSTVILDAVVTKICSHDLQHLEALLGGQPITVRVNSNVNFLPGMVIQSRQLVMKNTRVFDFIGRYPRAKGIATKGDNR